MYYHIINPNTEIGNLYCIISAHFLSNLQYYFWLRGVSAPFAYANYSLTYVNDYKIKDTRVSIFHNHTNNGVMA